MFPDCSCFYSQVVKLSIPKTLLFLCFLVSPSAAAADPAVALQRILRLELVVVVVGEWWWEGWWGKRESGEVEKRIFCEEMA